MLQIPVYSETGQQVGRVEIDEAHLGSKVRPRLLKQAVVMYQANRRVGTAATKNRSRVEGSTRKLYRQKGTGNARMGAVRTPQRRGGGRAFGKQPRDFRQDMPKRMRRLACRNALLAKILAQDVLVVEDFSFEKPATGRLHRTLAALGAGKGCVLTLAAPDQQIYKSGRAIPKTDVRTVADLNAYDILSRSKVVFTKSAFQTLASKLSA